MPAVRVDEELDLIDGWEDIRRRPHFAELRRLKTEVDCADLFVLLKRRRDKVIVDFVWKDKWETKPESEVVATKPSAVRMVKVSLAQVADGEKLLKRWAAIFGLDEPKEPRGWTGTAQEFQALLGGAGLRLRVRLEWVDREPLPAPNDLFTAPFLFSKEDSDSTVRVAGLDIPTHKIVLKQSPFFKALFRSGMRDAESGLVDLVEETEEDVRGLLTFLYVGHLSSASPWETSELEKRPLAFLRMGDFYGLDGLRAAAERTLVDQLEADNVGWAAEVAEEWGLETLGREAKVVADNAALHASEDQ